MKFKFADYCWCIRWPICPNGAKPEYYNDPRTAADTFVDHKLENAEDHKLGNVCRTPYWAVHLHGRHITNIIYTA